MFNYDEQKRRGIDITTTYKDVSGHYYDYPVKWYLGLNITAIVIYLAEIKFKMEKPPLSLLKKFKFFWPFLITIWLSLSGTEGHVQKQ